LEEEEEEEEEEEGDDDKDKDEGEREEKKNPIMYSSSDYSGDIAMSDRPLAFSWEIKETAHFIHFSL
jgi:hypothetical protein